MHMPKETNDRISKHMKKHAIPIIAFMCKQLQEAGCIVEPVKTDEPVSIWEAAITITKEDSEVEKSQFNFHNTFLEIFTVDRDADPLEFDEELDGDDQYIFDKIGSIIGGRLDLILGMLDGKTVEELYDEDRYERISKKTIEVPKGEEPF